MLSIFQVKSVYTSCKLKTIYFIHQELLSALFLTTITYYDVTQPSLGGLTRPAGPGSRRPSGNSPCKSALPCISSCRLASCWTQVCNRTLFDLY